MKLLDVLRVRKRRPEAGGGLAPFILVAGPESSGTRLLTRVLSSHPDVLGSPDADQHADVLDRVWSALHDNDLRRARAICTALPSQKAIVTRRSMPHGTAPSEAARYMTFPDLEGFSKLCASVGRPLVVLITSRSPAANLMSWTAKRASAGGEFSRALAQYEGAYHQIFSLLLRHRLPFLVLSLEGLVLDGESYVQSVLDLCGLPPAQLDAASLREPNSAQYDAFFRTPHSKLLQRGNP